MKHPPTIVLIGLRGSGKTTAGGRAALELGRPFVDLDDLVREKLGAATISEAWGAHGEACFRAAEFDVLQNEMMIRRGIVLSLGGGTPTAPRAAGWLRSAKESGDAVIIYLHADAATLRARLALADNKDRPSLTGAGVLDEVGAVLAQRDPLYGSLADHVIEVGGLAVDDVVGKIVSCVNAHRER